jgi:hypothetical protein
MKTKDPWSVTTMSPRRSVMSFKTRSVSLEQILIRHDHNGCGKEVQTFLGGEGGQGMGNSVVQSLD